jgi:hypothetical protein
MTCIYSFHHPRQERIHVSKMLLAVLALAAVWSASSEALAQPLKTVALIDAVKFPPRAATQAHERLRATMEETLSPKSWYLAQTSRPIVDCGGTPECMAKIAEDTGTQYVLRISGQKVRDFGYDITLDLFTTTTGYSRSSHAACDFCDPANMSKIASDTAVEMLTSVLKEEASQREKARRVVPTPVAAPAPTAPPTADLVTPPQPPVEPHHVSWVPWSMIGVGAVAAVYGGWALSQNNDLTSDKGLSSSQATRSRYSSKTLGAVTAGAGGALAIVGLVLLWVEPTQATRVSISPTGIDVALRF